MSDRQRDRLYAERQAIRDFVFDDRVAAVFDDMINRSVPGYATILSMIGMLADRYCQRGSTVYDLGCSLGGAALAMAHHIGHDEYRLIAVDSSSAMIGRLRERLESEPAGIRDRLEPACADIRETPIEDASMVVLNFTLQFIEPEQRLDLLRRIHAGMRRGGLLVLSEKIRFPDADMDELFVDMYHQFKQVQGYSELEVGQKRAALENVLVPEAIDTHKARLSEAGFGTCDVWFQCFNFASLVALK